MSRPERRAHIAAVIRAAVIAVLISELITFVLIWILLDQILIEGQLIALVCAGPITGWISDRQLRMRRLIADQRDRLAAFNAELNARNRDLDAFARAVAHDLRNPLTTVTGLAHILESDPSIKSADHDRAIPAIIESGERATEIIDALLLLHGIRRENPVLEMVDSEEVVERALRTLGRPIADKSAVVNRAQSFPTIRTYGPWLRQVLENLIGNAVKYGGNPPEIELSWSQTSSGETRFQVRDHGSGVPADAQDLIFNEFERIGAANEEGHGLGLAIVRRIVDRLGGQVGVDNQPDGGSMFWFTVPAAQD